ncbi:MAG: DUF3592 domain-containing protein [Acutalibacteraceae bacterium]
MKNKISTIVPIMLAVIFIATGVVGIIIVISIEQEDNEFFSKAETCTAYVNSVHTYTTRSRTGTGKHRRYRTTTHHDAYVSYTIDGVNYDNVKIPNVSGSVNRGDTLTLYYDPQKPGYARLKSNPADTWMSIGILSIFVIVGTVVLIISIKQKNRISQPQISTQSTNSTSETYNGYNNEPLYYTDNQNTYNDYGNNSDNFNSQQSSPFNTYGNNSYNDNSNNFNSQQASPFNTYDNNSYNDNSNNFNSQQASPFDTYGNNSYNDNSNNFNSQQASPFDTYGNNSQNDSSNPKSPFDKYK